MLAFSRITSVLFFVLSLSFFAYAAPTPAYDSNAVAPDYSNGQKVLELVVDLKGKVDGYCTSIVQLKTITNVQAKVDLLVADINTCVAAVVAIGTKIAVEDAVKANIALEVAAIITAIVHLCVSIVAKFGILVVLTILAKIDICLQLLLVNLGVCVEGILKLVAEIVVKLGVSVFASVHLGLCINVLGLVSLHY